jgi:hypothetical protein
MKLETFISNGAKFDVVKNFYKVLKLLICRKFL